MGDEEIIGGVTTSPLHLAPPSDQAVELRDAFEAGRVFFEQQLFQLSDQQYASLLTLLAE